MSPQDRGSRHTGLPTYRREVAGVPGELELFEPRLPDRPPAVARYRVEPTDRLDLIAARLLGDPHRYWRIADVNPSADLEVLEEIGRDLGIPGAG